MRSTSGKYIKQNDQRSTMVMVYLLLAMILVMFANSALATPMLRLQMKGYNNTLDETVLYYQAGASAGFDGSYDAYKLFGPNPAPHLSQQNGALFAINAISPVQNSFSINILATTPVTSMFTISALDFQDIPAGTCVFLHDRYTGNSINILATNFIFQLSDTTTRARFILSIISAKLPVNISLIQPNCGAPDGGKIRINQLGNGPWNYVWKDSAGNVVKSASNINVSDSLCNLRSGTYKISVTSLNFVCAQQGDTIVTILPVTTGSVAFTTPDSVAVNNKPNFTTTNQSQNCNQFKWSFGDQSANVNAIAPIHTYSASGIYEVKLRGVSASGCRDSASRKIKVFQPKTTSANTIQLTNKGAKHFVIEGANVNTEFLVELVVFQSARSVMKEVVIKEQANDIQLNFEMLDDGIYVIYITSKGNLVHRSKIVLQ